MELLGEETANYRPEFIGLYFNLKNVILQEIANAEKDYDVSTFFDSEAAPVLASKKDHTVARQKKNPRQSIEKR